MKYFGFEIATFCHWQKLGLACKYVDSDPTPRTEGNAAHGAKRSRLTSSLVDCTQHP